MLESLHTPAGTSVIPTATASIRLPDGALIHDTAIGDGPVETIFKAVERVTGIAANLREFADRGVAASMDTHSGFSPELEVESDDRNFRGRAASTDIIEAYINAVNAILTLRDRDQPREVIGGPWAGAGRRHVAARLAPRRSRTGGKRLVRSGRREIGGGIAPFLDRFAANAS
jgi:2-isopropylmalate synthase